MVLPARVRKNNPAFSGWGLLHLLAHGPEHALVSLLAFQIGKQDGREDVNAPVIQTIEGIVVQVKMGVNQAGRYCLSLEINHLCLGTLHLQDAAILADGHDFSVADRHPLRNGERIIGSQDLSIVKDHVGIGQHLRWQTLLGSGPRTHHSHRQKGGA